MTKYRGLVIPIMFVMVVFGNCNSKTEEKDNSVTVKEGYILKEMIVDDSLINKKDAYAVIEPLWWTVDIYQSEKIYRDGMNKFSENQQYVYAIEWYLAEVNNGGHDQFFSNSTGIVWKDALTGFEKTGMKENAEILKMAAKQLGGNPSFDREARQVQMENSKTDFGNLDSLFYTTDVENKLVEFIEKNRKDFYFKGTVNFPK
jgi:hypothetical protein